MGKPAQKTSRDFEIEGQLRRIERTFERHGITVRREKLSTGTAFKVKSGGCYFSGENIIFVDRRLPADQQLAVLVEYLIDAPFQLAPEEMGDLPAQARELIVARAA